MKVGDIVKLKVGCLGNSALTEGVVFNHYGTGFQVIFPNGEYDGFSEIGKINNQVEAEYFLEYVRHKKKLENYCFANVMQLSQDFKNGLFF